MFILFIHQNFPGQFIHISKLLVKKGHEVFALCTNLKKVEGVKYLRYKTTPNIDPIKRGFLCAYAMEEIKNKGFIPDIIIAHPGWGEALFCKDVFPEAKLIIFAEFYYNTNTDYGFDPEFSEDSLFLRANLRLRNTIHLHALKDADKGYSPTLWQHAQIPSCFKNKFKVIFDGIDTNLMKPDKKRSIKLKSGIKLKYGDEIITFINRNLEPYRGFHIFMRALPGILTSRPNARVIIIGGDEVSYGKKPKNGKNWKEVMLSEVGKNLPLERIHFLGRVSKTECLYVLQISACHIYLTYPFVLSWSCIEALSIGCLVIGSKTPPVEEVIKHGENGWLIDFFDKDALTKYTVKVLSERNKLDNIREMARKSVIKYDFSNCLPRLDNWLRI